MRLAYWCIGFLLALSSGTVSLAQTPQAAKQTSATEQHQFNRQTWKKAEDALDYTDHRNKPKEKKDQKEQEKKKTTALTSVQQAVVIALFAIVFGLIVIFILREFGINVFQWKKGKKEALFNTGDSGELINETELQRMLREALSQNDFRMAIRIYYLMIIKELSDRNWIKWRKEKTNFDYLQELKAEQHRTEFRNATSIYERVWYGERNIDAAVFAQINPQFSQLITQIKSPK